MKQVNTEIKNTVQLHGINLEPLENNGKTKTSIIFDTDVYNDIQKIASKCNISVNKIIATLAKDFRNQNLHLLNK